MSTWLEKLFRGGAVEVPLTADRALDEDTVVPVRLVVFTGALTANAIVTLPAVPGLDLVVRNSTSGGYSVTVKGSSGSGVVVKPGDTRPIICDDAGAYVESLPSTAYALAWYEGAITVTGTDVIPVVDVGADKVNCTIASNKITVGVAGSYRLSVAGSFSTDADEYGLTLRKNGADLPGGGTSANLDVGLMRAMSVETFAALAAGDQIDCTISGPATSGWARVNLLVQRIG